MNLGLTLGLSGQAVSGGTPTPPATPPSVVDSIQGGGGSSPQSGDTLLTATGANRAGVVSVMSGTSRIWTSVTATITGDGGSPRALTQDDFRYTNVSQFEAATQFIITEADYVAAGDSPYAIEVTATASNGTATKLGFAAASIQDAPNAPTRSIVSTGDGVASNTSSITPTAENSLVIAAQGSSTASGATTFTNATDLEINASFGDGVYMGQAQHGTTELTVSTGTSGRDVFALYAFAPG